MLLSNEKQIKIPQNMVCGLELTIPQDNVVMFFAKKPEFNPYRDSKLTCWDTNLWCQNSKSTFNDANWTVKRKKNFTGTKKNITNL